MSVFALIAVLAIIAILVVILFVFGCIILGSISDNKMAKYMDGQKGPKDED